MIFKHKDHLLFERTFENEKLDLNATHEEIAFKLNSAYKRYFPTIRAMIAAGWSYDTHMCWLGEQKLQTEEIEGFYGIIYFIKILGNSEFVEYRNKMTLCEKLHVYHIYERSESGYGIYERVNYYPRTIGSPELREEYLADGNWADKDKYRRHLGHFYVPVSTSCFPHREIANEHEEQFDFPKVN